MPRRSGAGGLVPGFFRPHPRETRRHGAGDLPEEGMKERDHVGLPRAADRQPGQQPRSAYRAERRTCRHAVHRHQRELEGPQQRWTQAADRVAPRRDLHSEGLGEIAEKYLAKGAKVFIEGALRTRKWQDQSGADRYSTEIHLTQYNGTLTVLDAMKDDARSSEQNAMREQANSNDGMTPKFDDETPFAPCWQ